MADRRTVGDYVTLQRGTTYKGNMVGKPGPALLGLGSIKPGGGFRHSDYKTYGGDCPEKLMLFPGDLFVSLKGATKDGEMIGSIARVPPTVLSGRLTQDTVKLVFCDSDYRIPNYIYWILRTPHYRSYCAGHATGSAVVALSRDDFLAYPVPPMTTERLRAIDLFEALEEKIELNRRMNETLEGIARALFQSWFVDFDPVRAKLDGRHPAGMDAETAALFSENLEDSSLGHIPRGWEVKTVGDIGDVICGKTPPTSVSDNYGDDIPFITIPDMHGSVFATMTAKKLSHTGATSQANKTLPPGSLCVSCIATPGLVVITSEDSQTNQQINSVIPHQKQETYFWYWVLTGLGNEIASSGSGGSVLVNLSKGRFEMLQVIKPPHALIHAYHATVTPLFESILANHYQSRSLAALRDTLLPKLLSGELQVEAAESELSEATCKVSLHVPRKGDREVGA